MNPSTLAPESARQEAGKAPTRLPLTRCLEHQVIPSAKPVAAVPAQSKLCSTNQKTEPAEPVPSQDLFSAFVRQLRASRTESANSRTGIDSDEILFDVELEGYRYLLVRAAIPTKLRLQLSPREQEIVRMVAVGHPNKVIAAVLNISPWTVGTHLRRIFAKFGVGSRAAMVAHFLEIGSDSNARPWSRGTTWSQLSSSTGVCEVEKSAVFSQNRDRNKTRTGDGQGLAGVRAQKNG